ncbi:MAG: hypothetical protein MUD01_00450 [Chloroflexaceae bacterium]|jgi:ABC-2 type transport system permease protein|nr:hypothetical protein [Chloroflexaceae bacterium]
MTTLHAAWVIAQARLLIARNTFWRGKLIRKIGIVVGAAVLGLAMWGLYQLSGLIVGGIRSPEFARALARAAETNPQLPTDITPYLLAVPSVTLFGALLMLVLSSFNSILSSLYLSGDIDMLLVAPVPMRSVFIVKFFGGLLPQYLLLFAFVAPILLGFGQGMGYGVVYYMATLLTLLLLPLLPAGLGALLVMAVVRVVPARRAREIVGVLGGLVGVAFYIFSQFSRDLAPRLGNVNNLNALLQLNLPLLPTAWAGRALLAAGEGQWLTLLAFGGLFTLVSLLIFGSCLLLAERLYYAGWSNMAMQGGRVRRKNEPRAGKAERAARTGWFSSSLSWLLPVQSQAIVYKDLRLFRRDLRNLQQLIFPLALAFIWAFQLFQGGNSSQVSETAQRVIGLGGIGVAFFICVTMSSALAGPGISREGKAFWILKLAPISALRMLLGKLALAYLPFPLLGTLFLLVTAFFLQLAPLTLLSDWALLLLTGLGSAAISVGLGAAFPRLNWENPQQQTTWRAGCISAVAFPLYLALMLVLVAGPTFLSGADVAWATPSLVLSLQLAGWVIAIALTGLVAWLSLRLGTWGLERIEV